MRRARPQRARRGLQRGIVEREAAGYQEGGSRRRSGGKEVVERHGAIPSAASRESNARDGARRPRIGLITKNASNAATMFSTIAISKIGVQLPVASLKHVAERNEQRRSPFRRVEKAVIRGRELLAPRIGAQRREEAEDFAVREEQQPESSTKSSGLAANLIIRKIASASRLNAIEHRVLAPDPVGDPAERSAAPTR